MCGINVDGENRFVIAPKPGGDLTFAVAEYKSVYGTVRSSWEKKDGEYSYEITIPANCEADIIINGKAHTVPAGTHTFEM